MHIRQSKTWHKTCIFLVLYNNITMNNRSWELLKFQQTKDGVHHDMDYNFSQFYFGVSLSDPQTATSLQQ